MTPQPAPPRIGVTRSQGTHRHTHRWHVYRGTLSAPYQRIHRKSPFILSTFCAAVHSNQKYNVHWLQSIAAAWLRRRAFNGSLGTVLCNDKVTGICAWWHLRHTLPLADYIAPTKGPPRGRWGRLLLKGSSVSPVVWHSHDGDLVGVALCRWCLVSAALQSRRPLAALSSCSAAALCPRAQQLYWFLKKKYLSDRDPSPFSPCR